MLTKERFLELVRQTKELEILDETETVCIVGCPETKTVSSISYAEIGKNAETNWDQLRTVLLGKREAHVIDHVTRVCGYFSQVNNWNQSKIGELRDRRAGNYSFKNSQL